jgi:hypothetical protein
MWAAAMAPKPRATWNSTFRAIVRDRRLTHAERTAMLAVHACANRSTGEVVGGLDRIAKASPFSTTHLSEKLGKAHELGYMETERLGARRKARRRVVFREAGFPATGKAAVASRPPGKPNTPMEGKDSASNEATSFPSRGRKSEQPRADVDRLCERLADRIADNGRPAHLLGWPSDAWRRECRLLLDRDGRDPAEAERLIDWCQNDPFWRSNVLGMPKFRERYDQLRLRADSAIELHVRNGSGPSHEAYERLLQEAQA